MSPFETQKRSAWFANLLEQAGNDIGHTDQRWVVRAMIAIKPAGLEGKILTINEFRDAITPFVGLASNNDALNNVARRCIKRGIMRRTGRKKYVEGTKNPYPEYEFCGHCEIDSNGGLVYHGGVRDDQTAASG